MFTMLFAIVKSLLSQSTIDKFRIYGTDENEWKAALLEHIDADQLPVHYGGTMTDVNGDPKCSAVVLCSRLKKYISCDEFERLIYSLIRAELFQLHIIYPLLNLCPARV